MGSGSSTSRQNSAKKQAPQNNMKDENQNQQNLKEQRRVERTENGQINHDDKRVREEDEVGSLKEELDRTISRDYDKMPPKRGSRSTLDSGISRDTSDGLLRHEHTALSQQEQEDLILNEFHSSKTEEYPEKYADKLRKQQQYDTVAFVLGREKTVLVRNPEEWNIDTSPKETDGFDPNKFKAVNRTSVDVTDNKEDEAVTTESSHEVTDVQPETDPLNMSTKSSKILKYDVTEEELMESIANEYEL